MAIDFLAKAKKNANNFLQKNNEEKVDEGVKTDMENKAPKFPKFNINSNENENKSIPPIPPMPPKGFPPAPKKEVLKEIIKEEVKETELEVKDNVLLEKNNPFIKKEETPKVEIIYKEPEKEEKKEEKKQEVKTEKIIDNTSKKEEVKEVQVEFTSPKEEKKEEVKEVKEEPKTKQTKRKTSKKKTEKTEEETSLDNIEIPETEISYKEAINSISPNFEDEEWKEIKKNIEADFDNLVISSGMNTVMINELLPEIDRVRDTISPTFTMIKSLYDSLIGDNGLINVTMKIAGNNGSNAEERKRNSILAVMNFKNPEGKNINLYEVLNETKIKYDYLKDKMDRLQFKYNILLTMSTNCKNQK